jgi:hypothetical protein
MENPAERGCLEKMFGGKLRLRMMLRLLVVPRFPFASLVPDP